MQFLKDLLFPKTCVGCGAIGSFICLRCQRKIVLLQKQRCFYCKLPSLYGFTHPACRKKHGVDGVVSLYIYNSFLKRVLKTAKYRLAREALDELLSISIPTVGALLYFRGSHFKSLPLQPTPLHSQRLRQRGFNQAELICSFLQKLNDGSRIIDVLMRSKNTPSQAQTKSHLKRYLNMKAAFKAKTMVVPQRLLVVDDVVTTGSTVRLAAETLKRAGVKQVYVFSLARG